MIGDALFASTVIRIGETKNADAYVAFPFAPLGNPKYMVLNVQFSKDLLYFNDHGAIVQEEPELTFMHEMIHYIKETKDLIGTGSKGAVTEADLNGSKFDYDGETLKIQNMMAAEAGYLDNIQASYQATFASMANVTTRGFVAGYSYTNAESVDNVRIGNSLNNDQDMSSRVDNSKDLLFGMDGDDKIQAGGGRDFLYGGAGSDTLHGGEGDDVIVGGDDDDMFRGGAGSDVMWGGSMVFDLFGAASGSEGTVDGKDTADYSTSNKFVTITVNTGSSETSISVIDGLGGTDTLHSIESVIGSSGKDMIYINGGINKNSSLTIDVAGGNPSPNPFDVINSSGSSGGIKLRIDPNNPSQGYIQDKATGGKILLVGFNTQIIGSSGDDSIIDDSSEQKRIDGGGGNDELIVSQGSALIDGGDGDDTLNGGDGNDILLGGKGENQLTGGDGADKLISTGTKDSLDGGDGHDFLQIGKDAVEVEIKGGAGNDIIDARAHKFSLSDESQIIYEFRSGDGHDSLLGMGSTSLSATVSELNNLDNRRVDPDTQLTWGVNEIVFPDISIDDVTFVWDFTVSDQQQEDYDFYSAARGGFAIVINATGESIFLGQVDGLFRSRDGGFSLISDDGVFLLANMTLPVIRFSDEVLWFDEDNTGWTNGHFVQGSVSAYGTAQSDHDSATLGPNDGDVDGTAGDDALDGGSGNEAVSGGDGNDDYQASGGTDTYDGGDGQDVLTIFGRSSGFDFHWQADGSVVATSRSGAEGVTTLVNVEDVYSVTENKSYTLLALTGDFGTNGNDSLISGTARGDHLFGLAGDDTLVGGEGDDVLNGGDDDDTARYAGDSADYRVYLDEQGVVTVQDLAGSDGTDGLLDIENIEFTGDSVTLAMIDIPALGTASGDLVEGNARSNRLFGLDGNDTLDGGAGNDVLEGGRGDDIYLFSAGDGSDAIVEKTVKGASYDVLDLSSFDPEDVVLTRGGGKADAADLLIRIVSTGEVIRVVGQFSDGYWDTAGIEEIRFDSAVTWDRATITANAGLIGTSGDDVLYGTGYNATIEAGDGNDTIHAYYGFDTVLFGAGDGHDTLIAIQRGATLKLIGLDRSDITMERDGNDLIVTVIATGATMTATDQFKTALSDTGQPESREAGFYSIEFATDGTFSLEDLAADIISAPIVGTSGNDIVTGTLLADVINGGDGNDTLYVYGYGSPDTLNGGAGNDELYGGDFGEELNGDDGDDHLTGSGGDDSLDGGDGADTAEYAGGSDDYLVFYDKTGALIVTDLVGYEGADAITNIEFVHFANDNVTINPSGTPALGTSGNDSIVGNGLRNAIYGLAGDDTLKGNTGNDTIDGGGDTDIAVYAGNSSDYVVYFDESGALLVEDVVGTDGVDTLVDIETVQFLGDSTTLDVIDVPALGTGSANLVEGDSRANRLFGLGGNDTLDGGTGDDRLIGGVGGDTYVVSSGDGDDVIVESYESGNDVLDLSWLEPGDIEVYRSGKEQDAGDLLIKVIATGDIIRVVGQFDGSLWSSSGIETILFDSAISWDREAMASNATIVATSGNDTIFASAAMGAIIDAKAGNDTIHSFYGSDTVIFRTGDGDDVFLNSSGQSDTLILDDIDLADLTIVRNGHDLIITITATGDSMTIVDQYSAWDSSGFGTFVFETDDPLDSFQIGLLATPLPVNGTNGADSLEGTDYGDSINGGNGNDIIFGYGSDFGDVLSGSAGHDIIQGSGASDTLNGDDGNDRLTGGEGNDTLNGGDGTDTAEYLGTSGDHLVFHDKTGALVVYDLVGSDGVDVITGIEFLHFTDDNVKISTSGTPALGTSGNDAIVGNGPGNWLFGLAGDDTLTGNAGNDIIDGGDDTDIAAYGGNSGNYLVYFDELGALLVEDMVGGDGIDTLVNIETIQFLGDSTTLDVIDVPSLGTELADLVTGDSRVNRLFGLGGDDTLDGGAGDDDIRGGGGNDELNGGDDDDTLIGGFGDDTIDGGGGNDVANFQGYSIDFVITPQLDGSVTLEDPYGGEGLDTLIDIEEIYFAGDNVTILVSELFA